MSNWLDRVRAPKYLRYFFYIAYSWYRPYKSDRSDAHFNSIVFLATFHGLLFLMLTYFFKDFFFPYVSLNDNLESYYKRDPYDEPILYGSILFTGALFYFIFLYQKKWISYVDEFSHLKKKDRRRGTFYLFVYLVICLFLAFSPIILDELFGIQLTEKSA
ncbi:hypothetical protein [Aquimarina longa]|uniref:hypothetical protein n=1 Tax=Aquimarina longa TaxID=1080221 RepID=UPI0007823E8A|nr:hypothetical protein [Aquimarina longa]